MTRLEAFLKHHGILPLYFAKRAQISRGHLVRLRQGTGEPRRPTMVRMARAASRILARKVRAQELFDLGDDPR